MDIERQEPHEIPDNNANAKKIRAFGLWLLICVVVVIVCVAVPFEYYEPHERYSVAIDSASVLDPRLGVSFNLTLGVASRSHGAKACIGPGTYVEVVYRGILVASSNGAETRRTCARPRDVAELPDVVARATTQPVGGALDSLAAEMGQGAALFDLRLVVPAIHRYRGKAYLLVYIGMQGHSGRRRCSALRFPHL